MISKIGRFQKLTFLKLFTFINIYSCSPTIVTIQNPSLSKVTALGVNPDRPLEKNNYLQIEFNTSKNLFSLSGESESMLQTRIRIYKGEKEIGYTFASGPFTIHKDLDVYVKNLRGDRYAVLFFRSLKFDKKDRKISEAISTIDFSKITVQLFYPQMFWKPRFVSNIIEFSKNQIVDILSVKDTSQIKILNKQ